MGTIYIASAGEGAVAIVCSMNCVATIEIRLLRLGKTTPPWDEYPAPTKPEYCVHCWACGTLIAPGLPTCALHDECPPSDWLQSLNAREFAGAFVRMTAKVEITGDCWRRAEWLQDCDPELTGSGLAEMVASFRDERGAPE